MSKTGYYMPWYLLGGAGVLTGGALMCKFFPLEIDTISLLIALSYC